MEIHVTFPMQITSISVIPRIISSDFRKRNIKIFHWEILSFNKYVYRTPKIYQVVLWVCSKSTTMRSTQFPNNKTQHGDKVMQINWQNEAAESDCGYYSEGLGGHSKEVAFKVEFWMKE